MARNINRVLLTGNVVRKPELRHTAGGTAVCEFSIAVNGSEKVDGEWRERADFFDVVIFGNGGENAASMLDKGTPVAVDGKLRLDRWETKAGEARRRVSILADNWQFTSKKGDGSGGGSGGGGSPFDEGNTDVSFEQPQADFTAPSGDGFKGVDDDIPF